MHAYEHSTAPVSSGEWARIPGTGQRLEGLCRGEIYALIREGKIRALVLRKPGKKRSIRLVHLPSLRNYIEAVGTVE